MWNGTRRGRWVLEGGSMKTKKMVRFEPGTRNQEPGTRNPEPGQPGVPFVTSFEYEEEGAAWGAWEPMTLPAPSAEVVGQGFEGAVRLRTRTGG